MTTTRTITASGSDVTQTTTVWHVWEHPAEVLDPETFDWENPGTALDPVFIEDIPTETLVSLTYNHTDDGTGSPQGTSVFLQREEGGRYDNPDGTLSTGTWQITLTTNLTTGVQTTDITSTFPAEILDPAVDADDLPGAWYYFFHPWEGEGPGYWHYLTNPSDMDDGLETGFYWSAGIGAGALTLAGGMALAGVNVTLWGGGSAAGAATPIASEIAFIEGELVAQEALLAEQQVLYQMATSQQMFQEAAIIQRLMMSVEGKMAINQAILNFFRSCIP